MRYFRKEVPKTPIYMPKGRTLQFSTDSGLIGYYATDNTEEIDALKKLESEHRGGVFEIGQAEYDSKKKAVSATFDYNSKARESIGGGIAQDTMVKRASPTVPAPVVPESKPNFAPDPESKMPRPPNVGKRIL